jgi:hypothetical protein
MRIIIIILLTLSLNISARASFDFNTRCRNAYEQMMLFDFSEAQSILNQEKKLHPNNKVTQYIEAYIAFWKAALNENLTDMEQYDNLANTVINAISKDQQNSPFKNYFLSDMYLRGAYLKAMEKSYMTAAYRFNKAYNLSLKNQKEYPNFIPNKKLVGLMNVGIGSVPKKYNWVLTVFNFEGDINQGLSELNQLLIISAHEPKYHYLLSESLLIYSFTMLNFEVNKEKEEELLKIYDWDIINNELTKNQFMIFGKASFLKHLKKNNEAIECVLSRKPNKTSMHFYYLDYMLGECLLYRQDSLAANYLSKYVTEYHGLSYRRSACQKWAWTYLLDGKQIEYRKKIKLLLTFGDDNRDSDQQATKEAESGISPNVTLLKARLLFDGGYYKKANHVLKTANTQNFTKRDRMEYLYRFARIYDEWGKQDLAITNYKRSIATGQNLDYYFAANSALHLGYIYERKGDLKMAKTLYQKCLDMDFEEYHNSITQKAKAALNRLEEK